MKCPHCGKFIPATTVAKKAAAKGAAKAPAAKPQKKMYHDGILVGMTMWHVKAIYKIGQAGRKGRGGVKMSPGAVFDELKRNGCIMLATSKGKKPAKWMLTAVGQYYYGNIKFK